MAESAFTIAKEEYDCPHCGARKGETCKYPSGRIKRGLPHSERAKQLSESDYKRCIAKVYTMSEMMDKVKIAIEDTQYVRTI